MKTLAVVLIALTVLALSSCAQHPDGSWHPVWQPPGYQHRPWVPSVVCREGRSWSGGKLLRCY